MRDRHVWPGLLLLASLGLLLGVLVAWGDHFLTPGPSGGIRRLLQLWAASRPAENNAVAAEEFSPAPSDNRRGRPQEPRFTSATAPPDGPAAPMDARPAAPIPPAARPSADPPRYALDLGTFALAEEVEHAEAQFNQAGFSTVRFRQQEPARLFSVFVPLAGAADQGQEIAARLRDGGFAEAVIESAPEGLAIRVAPALPLRTAVRIAERVRLAGPDPAGRAALGRSAPLAPDRPRQPAGRTR